MSEGLLEVHRVKTEYDQQLKSWKNELNQALLVSLDLSLPKPLSEMPTLAFNLVKRHQATQPHKFEPKKMHELGCINQAIATYTVKSLKKKKVLLEIHPPFKVMESKM